MREIKFRAWNKVTKEMYNDAINNCKDSFDLVLKHPQIYKVMQYTGLKDKNGKEIYEGDILDCSYINPMSQEKIKRYFEVVYGHGLFAAKLTGHSPAGDTLLYFKNSDGEVIGNIYENPELLEV